MMIAWHNTWTMILFDAPTDTPEAIRANARFVKAIRKIGDDRNKVRRGTWSLALCTCE